MPGNKGATFTTDFGVTFGLFVCFDIMFETPAVKILEDNVNVTDVIFPTAWLSMTPFLTCEFERLHIFISLIIKNFLSVTNVFVNCERDISNCQQ